MSREVWFYVNDAGELICHTENDGWTFMRKGSEAYERPMAVEDALRQYPFHREEIYAELKAYKEKEAK